MEGGTWDASDTTHWATSSGAGVGGASVPGSGDVAIFDALSAPLGGTCTVNTTVTVQQITMGAFTGTLDFSANNNNVTLQTFSGTGIGARVLNMGNGTWTITASTSNVWECTTVTNFTLNANSSTLDFASTPTNNRQLNLGGKTYNNISVTNAVASPFNVDFASAGAFTVSGNLTFTNVRQVRFAASTTINITGTLTYNGTQSQQGMIYTTWLTATVSVGATNILNWVLIQSITKAGAGSISAVNSFDGSGNIGVTITGPGGGARIVSG